MATLFLCRVIINYFFVAFPPVFSRYSPPRFKMLCVVGFAVILTTAMALLITLRQHQRIFWGRFFMRYKTTGRPGGLVVTLECY